MTYEEALKMATKNMSPLGYFPWEIKDAALKMVAAIAVRNVLRNKKRNPALPAWMDNSSDFS